MEQSNYTTSTSMNQVNNNNKIYSHLSLTQRREIERLLNYKRTKAYEVNLYRGEKITLDFIAKQIGVHKSTVSREIKRGNFRCGVNTSGTIYRYQYDVAHNKAKEKRANRKQITKLNSSSKELKVLEAIINNEKISPENAIYQYEKYYGELFPVCLKTVYKYIYRKIIKIKYNVLRFQKKSKAKKGLKSSKRIQKGENISQRPEEAQNRSSFGHWEGDTVYSSRGDKSCILTLVERTTRLFIEVKIKDRTANSVVQGINQLENKLGFQSFKKLFQTITFDNGLEFSKFEELEQSCIIPSEKRMQIYFANPYHSWERGSNENLNGWLRYYFPKGTFFENVSLTNLQNVCNKINFSYRRILGGKSAYEAVIEKDPQFIEILNLLEIENPFKTIGKYFEKFNMKNFAVYNTTPSSI